jgi:hypothetical protein
LAHGQMNRLQLVRNCSKLLSGESVEERVTGAFRDEGSALGGFSQ